MSLQGTFYPPGDKSISHRLVLISLLAKGESRLENLSPCADVESSLKAVELLGSEISRDGESVVIGGAGGNVRDRVAIDCGNSGTTMRLLMGILAGLPGEFTLDGDDSLRRRPMERVAAPLRLMGGKVACEQGKPPVAITGSALHGIDYQLPVASAQLKTAILLAGLQAEGWTLVGEPVLSRDHTEMLIAALGGQIQRTGQGPKVARSAITLPPFYRVPGDISSAAFFLCAAAIIPQSEVTAEGVLLNPTRTGFLEVLKRMGAEMEIETQGDTPEPWGRVRVRYSPNLTGCQIAPEEIPLLVDEVPILSLVATQARGATVFHGVGELRIKESDRLAAVASGLGLMGANVVAEGEELTIEGPTPLKGSEGLDSFGDHRIAMTLRLGLLLAGSENPVKDEACARVSYPSFHEELARLAS